MHLLETMVGSEIIDVDNLPEKFKIMLSIASELEIYNPLIKPSKLIMIIYYKYKEFYIILQKI